jgi:hypothetical protein
MPDVAGVDLSQRAEAALGIVARIRRPGVGGRLQQRRGSGPPAAAAALGRKQEIRRVSSLVSVIDAPDASEFVIRKA